MIRKLLISRHYAEAFVSYALSVNADLKLVCVELRGFCDILKDVSFTKLNMLFMNRTMPIFLKTKMWQKIYKFFNLSDISNALISAVINNGRSELIEDILNSVEEFFSKKSGYTKVSITIANLSDTKALESIKREISKNMKLIPIFECIEDKSILGGVVVAWDSNILDMSVRGKLNRLMNFITQS